MGGTVENIAEIASAAAFDSVQGMFQMVVAVGPLREPRVVIFFSDHAVQFGPAIENYSGTRSEDQTGVPKLRTVSASVVTRSSPISALLRATRTVTERVQFPNEGVTTETK